MADKLWYLSKHVPCTSAGTPGATYTYLSGAVGGLTPPGFYFDHLALRYRNGECTVAAGGTTVFGASGAPIAGRSFLLMDTNLFSADAYDYTDSVSAGTFEMYVSVSAVSSVGLLVTTTQDDDYTDDNLNYDALYQGFQVLVDSATNEISVKIARSDTTYNTGLFLSGSLKHFMLQIPESLDKLYVGVDGDVYIIPEVPTYVLPWVIGNSALTAVSGPRYEGVNGVVKDVRVVLHRERYAVDEDLLTYTPDAAGYSAFSAPASPLTLTHTVTALADVPRGTTVLFSVTDVTGGTPPYSYEWVEYAYGKLDWEVDPRDTRFTDTVYLDTTPLNDLDGYSFGCIVTDSVGTVAFTCSDDPTLHELYMYSSSGTNEIINAVVYAKPGDTVEITPRNVVNSAPVYAWKWTPYYNDRMTISVVSAATNGTLYGEYDDPVWGTGKNDSYRIFPVTADDDGARVRMDYWFTTAYSEVELRLSYETSEDGWWRDLVNARQTELEDNLHPDFYKSFQEGYDFADDFINGPDYGSLGSAYEDQLEYPIWGSVGPDVSALTEYHIGQYGRWAETEYGADPWTYYSTTAEFTWGDLSDAHHAGQCLGVDVGYWHFDVYYNYFGSGGDIPAPLKNNGSPFTASYLAAYWGTIEGAFDGKQDALAANPKFTSKAEHGRFVGTPYRQDYLDRYDYGYEYGWAHT